MSAWFRLRIWCERLVRFEYWPTWAVYLAILPALAWCALRHRSTSVWAACNPGIPACGGLVGEQKHLILRELDAAARAARLEQAMLAWALIPAHADAEVRLRSLDDAMARLHLTFPLILKPDVGERGYALKLARSREEARAYLAGIACDVIAQQFHPGPHECGLLWVRRPERERAANATTAGFLYSITAKQFPRLTGDGVRTLRALILAHPRFRRQHSVFFARLHDQLDRVPAAGEVVPLGVAGNHCQGTLFADGEHLRSPQLEATIDALARRFGDTTGQRGTLDMGRFDVRFTSDEDLRAGRFAIVEMNGTSAESTNMYDPDKPLFWSLRVLAGQWRLMFALGADRVRAGSPPPTALGVLRVVRAGREVQARRGGTAIAD